MQTSYDQYLNLINKFYRKVVKQHPRKSRLIPEFLNLVHQKCMSDPSEVMDNPIHSCNKRTENDICSSDNSMCSFTKHSKCQHQYSNQSLKRVLMFAYLYHLVKNSKAEIFNMLEAKVNLLLEEKEQSIRGPNYGWSSVCKLIQHKHIIRWQKVLADSFPQFDDQFINVLQKAILGPDLSRLTPDSDQCQSGEARFKEEWLLSASNRLKVSILSFVDANGQISNLNQIGICSSWIRIGYFKATKKYVFFNKMPKESNSHKIPMHQTKKEGFRSIQESWSQSHPSFNPLNQRSKYRGIVAIGSSINLLRRKTLRTVQTLLNVYQSNSQTIGQLQAIDADQQKYHHIKQIIQKRNH